MEYISTFFTFTKGHHVIRFGFFLTGGILNDVKPVGDFTGVIALLVYFDLTYPLDEQM